MTALAPTSFEINMVVTEVTEDNTSDISEEIDELAGDLEPTMEVDTIKNAIPNNDKKLVPFNNDDNSSNNEKEQEKEDDEESDSIYEIEKIVDHRTYRV